MSARSGNPTSATTCTSATRCCFTGGKQLDVWLLCWLDVQETGLHDHDLSAGALYVCGGTLVEDVLRFSASGSLGTARRQLHAGASRAFDVGHIHSVSHVGVAPATSIHVYSPALRGMGHYEWVAEACGACNAPTMLPLSNRDDQRRPRHSAHPPRTPGRSSGSGSRRRGSSSGLSMTMHIPELARVARDGVHEPGRHAIRQCLDRQARRGLGFGVRTLLLAAAGSWDVNAGHFLSRSSGGAPIGVQQLTAEDFPVLRAFGTGSWLSLAYHGKGFGTEMRAAVSISAFASSVPSSPSPGPFREHGSIRVSERSAISRTAFRRDRVRGRPVDSLLFRLPRDLWEARTTCRSRRFEGCERLFGLDPARPGGRLAEPLRPSDNVHAALPLWADPEGLDEITSTSRPPARPRGSRRGGPTGYPVVRQPPPRWRPQERGLDALFEEARASVAGSSGAPTPTRGLRAQHDRGGESPGGRPSHRDPGVARRSSTTRPAPLAPAPCHPPAVHGDRGRLPRSSRPLARSGRRRG